MGDRKMKNNSLRKMIIGFLTIVLILGSGISAFGIQINILSNGNDESDSDDNNPSNPGAITKHIDFSLSFSYPDIVPVPYSNASAVHIPEANHNRIILFDFDTYIPVLPVSFSVHELEFGSKIVDLEFEYSTPEIIELPGFLSSGKAGIDSVFLSSQSNEEPEEIMYNDEPYPNDWVIYHTGGGISQDEHVTFLVIRVYPCRYYPTEMHLKFISEISVHITYEEPDSPLIEDNDVYDLLILSPDRFKNILEPLVTHKESHGIKTKLVTLEEIVRFRSRFRNRFSIVDWDSVDGRDEQEKIKNYIKQAVEEWGVKYVLLVGGRQRQSSNWLLPVRYSHVVPPEEQEYAELEFLSDLYYADIYDGEGSFSSWDSNGNNIFAEWTETGKDELDNYPDVYLGRLPCRNTNEAQIMVDKILKYEESKVSNQNWFKNLVLVGGDSYISKHDYNEGELACDEAINRMPSFNPVKVYATIDDINGDTVNDAMNQGAGFAYFCGHGSSASWNTHFYPAEPSNWCTGYHITDMLSISNGDKLPITVVGGCHNGEFDISIINNIIWGIKNIGLKYFFGRFWFDGWIPNCWAWFLTSKANGGAIACIANTGLGTHGEEDQDANGIADYLEVLDGWLELRFLELYGTHNQDILGENHAQTITEYLHKFLGDDSKMDLKMVQQWELFGDPSLKIGGYN
jgi:hypothetical protein